MPRSPIDNAIDRENWPRARTLLREALKKEPGHHWLLAHLAFTYIAERRYRTAARIAQRAYSGVPNCPLVIWYYALALELSGQPERALELYQGIIRRGVQALAFGLCGEGLPRARSLVADAHYRKSRALKALGRARSASLALSSYLRLRRKGYGSLYRLSAVRRQAAVA